MYERNYSIEQVRKAAKENYGSFNPSAKVGYYIFLSVNINDITEIKKPTTKVAGFFCGERGIRTPGGVTLNSFQDCRIRPLCHFSNGCKYNLFFCF